MSSVINAKNKWHLRIYRHINRNFARLNIAILVKQFFQKLDWFIIVVKALQINQKFADAGKYFKQLKGSENIRRKSDAVPDWLIFKSSKVIQFKNKYSLDLGTLDFRCLKLIHGKILSKLDI